MNSRLLQETMSSDSLLSKVVREWEPAFWYLQKSSGVAFDQTTEEEHWGAGGQSNIISEKSDKNVRGLWSDRFVPSWIECTEEIVLQTEVETATWSSQD